MTSSDKELQEQLLEAGNKLADPPSSVEELLSLLDRVESFLSRVEQSPTNSMQNALSPSFKALTAEKLFRHSDADVKVAVASCISEITRITAPDAPYDDDQMKDVFQLIVSSFENLRDKSSRSYAKRTSMLETVAKVRSCVVMLDLECDALILEMFKHFLKEIREHHPDHVFSCMETIMTLVLEESEDISVDLLTSLLTSVKKDNEEVLPIAQKLGERVIESCASKLKPYLVQAVKTLALSVGDYSPVLASICCDASDSLEQNNACVTSKHVEDESKSAKPSVGESMQVAQEDASEAAPSQQDIAGGDRSPKSVMSNGITQVGEDVTLADPKSFKKQEDAECSDQSKAMDTAGQEVPNDLDTERVDNSEQKPAEQTTKSQGRKTNGSTKLAEPSECRAVSIEKEAEKMIDSGSHSKEVHSSPPNEDHSVDTAGPLDNDKEINAKISSPKAGDDESEIVASPSPSESLHDEKLSKKVRRAKMKDNSAKEVSVEDASRKVSDGTSDSEAKPARRSGKKALGRISDVKNTSVEDSVKKGSGTSIDPNAKKHSAKKVDESNKVGVGSSARQLEEKKRLGRGKSNSETVLTKSSIKDVDKETVSSPRSGTKLTKDENPEDTPKTNMKRKHNSGQKNESGTKENGENLVGLRVKVWWPKDREFYKGIIDSYDSAKKKHKVLYDDGDQEILNLKKEKWKIINDSDSDVEEGTAHASLDASADIPPKKKGKTSACESTKQGKIIASSKSGGAAASSGSKGASLKSSQKSKHGSKSKDFKSDSKSEDEINRKSKDGTPKSGINKSAQKSTGLFKNTDSSKTSKSKDNDKKETPKSGKSKQDTPKTAASKGKLPKSGGKSNVNDTDKVKSGLLKRKDLEDENSDVSARGVVDTKGKASSSPKVQGSEAKSGKKRKKS